MSPLNQVILLGACDIDNQSEQLHRREQHRHRRLHLEHFAILKTMLLRRCLPSMGGRERSIDFSFLGKMRER